ncbi:MAG: hypothetical protein DSY42_04190, partial [Aquifex sp.]
TSFRALRNKDKFRDGTNFKAWLFTIMKNIFINNYRKKIRANTIMDATDNNYYINSGSAVIENNAESNIMMDELTAMIDSLEDGIRIPFMMHYEGFKYQEIADELELPLGTIKSRIFFARKEMKDLKEIIYRVKEMYYALLYKRLVKELKEDNLKYWEENLKIVEEKYKAGILPKVEYMRAKAQYEMAKAQLEETKADYEKSLEEFKAFLRIEGDVEPSGGLNLKFPYKFPKEEELMKALLENNSTLKVARARVEIAEKVYGLAKSDYYPSVDAFLSYEGFTTRRTLFGGKEWVKGYVFGISLNYKFFDGFSRETNIAQRRLEILKEKEKLKDTLFTLKKDLKNALLTLRSLKARIKAVKTSLEAAKESLRLSTERYKEGVANQLEVLDARTNYNNALENLHFLLYRYFTVLALVERLTR